MRCRSLPPRCGACADTTSLRSIHRLILFFFFPTDASFIRRSIEFLDRFCARDSGLKGELKAVLAALDAVRRIKVETGASSAAAAEEEPLSGVVTDIFHLRPDLDFSAADDIRVSASCHRVRARAFACDICSLPSPARRHGRRSDTGKPET